MQRVRRKILNRADILSKLHTNYLFETYFREFERGLSQLICYLMRFDTGVNLNNKPKI